MRIDKIVFSITGAKNTEGGIASSNINILLALSNIVNNRDIELVLLSFLESSNARPRFLPKNIVFSGYKNNKFLFSKALLSQISRNSLFIFDHVSLALPILPFSMIGITRSVIFAHGSESWKRLKYLNKLSFKNSSLCLANSNYTLKKMNSAVGEFKGKACPLGLSPEFDLNEELTSIENNNLELKAVDGNKYKLGNRFLLLVARIHPDEGEKGHKQLIEILPRLRDKYPDIQLVFPGTGEGIKYLSDLSKELCVSSSVFFPGFVSADKLCDLYQGCYAFVMPSLQEGFGLVYLEAMNFGKPCLGCYDQGAEDIIINDQTGYLINNPSDLDELYSYLVLLLDNPEKAKEMGAKGFERLNREFTSEHYQNRLINSFEQLLNGNY